MAKACAAHMSYWAHSNCFVLFFVCKSPTFGEPAQDILCAGCALRRRLQLTQRSLRNARSRSAGCSSRSAGCAMRSHAAQAAAHAAQAAHCALTQRRLRIALSRSAGCTAASSLLCVASTPLHTVLPLYYLARSNNTRCENNHDVRVFVSLIAVVTIVVVVTVHRHDYPP